MGYTIKDIAQESGVSPTTVSLIVNNKPCRISEETRQIVLDVVKKYNYRPNSSARALVTKKTETIGLIVPDISNPFFAELSKGVEREARIFDYSIILCNSDDSGKKDIKNTDLLSSRQVDGLILAPSLNDYDTEEIEKFNRMTHNKLPVVLIDRQIPYFSYNSALIDHRIGGYLATEHLIRLGHRKIGCITGPLHLDSGKKRFQGYQDALKMGGLDFCDSYIYNGNYQVDSGLAGGEALMQKGVTAIFACNDLMAFGCIRQARQMNLLPGRDISIVGFDDIPICDLLDQPLTTVNQPLYELGKISFQLLYDQIISPQTKIQTVTLPPSLIIRGTTSAPPL